MLELADVSRPRMAHKGSNDLRAGRLKINETKLLLVAASKVLHKQGNVGSAVSQRRQHDFVGGEAIEEVFAKLTRIGLRAEVAVGGGDDPDRNLNRIFRTHRSNFSRLQKTQQLDLQRCRELTDLVEEESAVSSGLDGPAVIAVRTGERALAVAE